MRHLILTVAVLVAVLSAGCLDFVAAKGITGSGRASGGGYYRSSKVGYYSRTNRYYVNSMYWRSGYSYAYKGPTFRTTAGALSAEQLTDLICKRDVRVDTTMVNYGSTITFNSTQRCYNENSNTPGAAEDVVVDTLMLNRFRSVLNTSRYPTLDYVVYPDKDIYVGLVNNSLRFTTVTLATTSGVTSNIDLASLIWQPCTLNSCATSNTQSAFGYPSSRFVEGGRVYTVALQASYTDATYSATIGLRFWISNDFDEDAIYDHVFLMPGAVKIDITVTPQNTATSAATVSVTALLTAPESGVGSQVQFLAIPAANLATEYNPQRMQRYQIGSSTDVLNGQASYLSWAAAADRNVLCFTAGSGTCMTASPQTSTDITAAIACRSTDGTFAATCADLLRPGQVAYRLRWTASSAISTSATGWSWSMNLGYHDQSVGTQTDSAASQAASLVAVFFAAALLLVANPW